MQKLIQGVHSFQTQEFRSYSGLFQRLSSDGQKPHTLFITCADSRVLAELITGSKPVVEEHKAAVKKAESEDIFDRF